MKEEETSDELNVNRQGKVTEYKRGHYYLTNTQWEDGHVEIEVHRCVPELLWHSCDINQLDEARELFKKLEHKHPTDYKQSEHGVRILLG